MKKSIKILWRAFFACMALFILLVLAINWGLLGYMPSMKELENPQAAVASEVYFNDGGLLGKYYITDRSTSKFSEISPNVINALVATEDARFYEHSGIDGVAVLRAVLFLGKKGGGSTITQQLAKNLFHRENQNFFTMPIIKLKEWILAVKLERNLTKNEIITLYLNTVPFGDNTYGIKNASQTFFNVPPDKLNVDQAAVLVGMLKGNTIFNPRTHPERSLQRRNVVIDQMVKYAYLQPEEGNSLKEQPIRLDYNKLTHNDGAAPYFRQIVEQQVKQWCAQHTKQDGTNYDLYKDGLKIYTTIDPKMQQYAEAAVEDQLKILQPAFFAQSDIKSGSVWKQAYPTQRLQQLIFGSDRYKSLKDQGLTDAQIMDAFKKPVKMTVFTWKSRENKKDTTMSPIDSIKYMREFVQAGFMVMDPFTGEIKAWVGGINHDYFMYDHVNMATKRQVGSTIKPLLYCLAVDNGYSPCSDVQTSPQVFPGNDTPYDANGGKYGYPMAMNRALAQSVNNASLYLLNQVGIPSFIDFIHRCGITSNIDPVPSIALGVSDISLFEMLGAYTMFPNRGIRSQPFFVSKIEDKNGNILENFVPVQKEIINPITAFKMVKMMQGVADGGTASRLRYMFGLNGDIAGKTGTTNNQADGWFIGYTPQLLAGVWVGCDDRFLRFSSMSLGQVASAALPIWAYFFRRVYSDRSLGLSANERFVAPDGFQYCGDDYNDNSQAPTSQPAADDNADNGDDNADNITGDDNP